MSDDSAPTVAEQVARRRRAVLAGHEADEATARSMLSDHAGTVRASAVAALDRMGRLADEELRGALTDRDPVVRRRAVALAVGRSTVDLVPLLDDADNGVVEQAAWACGERPAPEAGAVTALARLAVGHDDPLVREAAVAALGAIGDPAGLPAILSGTSDKPAVRRRAVLALAPFDGPEVDAALQRAATDADWQVRQAAEDLLDPGPHDPSATPSSSHGPGPSRGDSEN